MWTSMACDEGIAKMVAGQVEAKLSGQLIWVCEGEDNICFAGWRAWKRRLWLLDLAG